MPELPLLSSSSNFLPTSTCCSLFNYIFICFCCSSLAAYFPTGPLTIVIILSIIAPSLLVDSLSCAQHHLVASQFLLLFSFGLFPYFSFPPSSPTLPGFGWLRRVMWRHLPTVAPSGSAAAVGDSLWSLGLGSAPQCPPAPGRLHRSISWAGTVNYPCGSTSLLCSPVSLLITCRLKEQKRTTW